MKRLLKITSVVLSMLLLSTSISFAQDPVVTTTPDPATPVSQDPAVTATPEPLKAVDVMVAKEFNASNGIKLPYRIYLPPNYDASKSYSLLLFFHGAGARASDNTKHLGFKILGRIINGEKVTVGDNTVDVKDEFIMIAPQCALDYQWVDTPWDKSPDASYSVDNTPKSLYMTAAEELLNSVESEYSVNKKRIYVSGVSMGGFGTWDMIMRNPYKFAAAIPMSGGADPTYAEKLSHLPIWTFHQVLDETVFVNSTESMVKALVKAGGNIKYTTYFEKKHNAWDVGHSDPDLLQWLCNQENKFVDEKPQTKPTSIIEGMSEWATSEASLAIAMKLIPETVTSNYQSNITRAEFCQSIVKAFNLGEPTQQSEMPFTDTTDASILKAYQLGIVNGVAEKTFAPDASITREEICTMLVRAINKIYPTYAFSTESATFADENLISDWAKTNVVAMSASKAVLGDEIGQFNPQGNTTREQAILILYRIYMTVMKTGIANLKL